MYDDYFDWAATSPMCSESIEAYSNAASSFFGNPSSVHAEGQKARQMLDLQRSKCASLLGCRPSELYFTSGGTESDSIILNSALMSVNPGNIIISKGEHSAIKQYERSLKQLGWTVSYLPCPKGYASPADLASLLRPDTRFVFIMLVNNILGTIEDIDSMVKVCREYEKTAGRRIHIHVDAVQACGKIPIRLDELGIDSAAFSAHKFCGPRGVGMLFLRNPAIQPISPGGGQEKGLRPGTENLPGICAMAAALELECGSMEKSLGLARKIREKAEKMLSSGGFELLSPQSDSGKAFSPYIINVSTRTVPSEVFSRVMSDREFCISSGSACNNNSRKKTEGLSELGFSASQAGTSIRVSFGCSTTIQQMEKLCTAMISVLKELS